MYGYFGIAWIIAFIMWSVGDIIGHGVVHSVVPRISSGETWPALFFIFWHGGEPGWQYTTKGLSMLLWFLEGPILVISPALFLVFLVRDAR